LKVFKASPRYENVCNHVVHETCRAQKSEFFLKAILNTEGSVELLWELSIQDKLLTISVHKPNRSSNQITDIHNETREKSYIYEFYPT